MSDNSETIMKEMDHTKASLAEKLGALEHQVTETVHSATSAVSDTVNTVKDTVESVTDTVQDTVHSATEVFDIRLQVQRRPWVVVGGSVAAGAALGYFLAGLGRRVTKLVDEAEKAVASAAPAIQSTASTVASATEEGTGWLSEQFGQLKGLAVGSAMGVVRDLATQYLPESLVQRVTEEVDHLTTSLGGEPIRGSILSGTHGSSGHSNMA